jgi:hypothetical protein
MLPYKKNTIKTNESIQFLTFWIEHKCDHPDERVTGHQSAAQHHSAHIHQRSKLRTSAQFMAATGEQNAEIDRISVEKNFPVPSLLIALQKVHVEDDYLRLG